MYLIKFYFARNLVNGQILKLQRNFSCIGLLSLVTHELYNEDKRIKYTLFHPAFNSFILIFNFSFLKISNTN